jgi:hypothetical protein
MGHGRPDDVRSTHGRGFSAFGDRVKERRRCRPARPPRPRRRGPLDRRDRLPARPRASHGEGLPVGPHRREGTRGQRVLSRRVPRLRRGTTARRPQGDASAARPATPARSKHGGRANWCATRCAPGASAPAPRRPPITGLAPTRDAAAVSRWPAWPIATGPPPAPSPTSTAPVRPRTPTPSRTKARRNQHGLGVRAGAYQPVAPTQHAS